LRDRVVAGAHLAYHFLWKRVLQLVGGLPWSLTRGERRDKAQAIDDLAADEDEPDAGTTRQLWALARAGFSKQQLVATLTILGELPWTTMTTEQQHGTLSVLHRHHLDYELNMLVLRGFLLMFRRLIPSVSDTKKRLHRLNSRLQKALRAKTQKVRAKSSHLQDAWADVRRHGDDGGRGPAWERRGPHPPARGR
jgi:hypothetical protein